MTPDNAGFTWYGDGINEETELRNVRTGATNYPGKNVAPTGSGKAIKTGAMRGGMGQASSNAQGTSTAGAAPGFGGTPSGNGGIGP